MAEGQEQALETVMAGPCRAIAVSQRKLLWLFGYGVAAPHCSMFRAAGSPLVKVEGTPGEGLTAAR